MKTITWPYGTRIMVDIDTIDHLPGIGMNCIVARHVDAPSTATILLLSSREIAAMTTPPVRCQRRAIVFRQGGPTGGHWAVVDGEAVRDER